MRIELGIRRDLQTGRLATDGTLDFGILGGEQLIKGIINAHNVNYMIVRYKGSDNIPVRENRGILK
jgi:hypothetical protein|nr:MAG TPA: hypothetical protein [Caudoviricetes sp.]